jgi:hypothetical protein
MWLAEWTRWPLPHEPALDLPSFAPALLRPRASVARGIRCWPRQCGTLSRRLRVRAALTRTEPRAQHFAGFGAELGFIVSFPLFSFVFFFLFLLLELVKTAYICTYIHGLMSAISSSHASLLPIY